MAHELAGESALAEAEWHSALTVVEGKLRSAPNDVVLLLWSAWLHASLQETAEAERQLSRAQTLAGLKENETSKDNVRVFLRLKKHGPVLAGLRRILQARNPGWQEAHSDSRYDPQSDFLRGNPEFEKLLRDNLPPGAKPFPPLTGTH
jgi:hypothetical protein